MKVLLINGSPHQKGCTYTALSIVADELEKNGIETEIFQIGSGYVRGCIGCGGCAKKGDGKCVFDDDVVNKAIEASKTADAFVFGTPVHYAAACGSITSLLDRMFYAGGSNMDYKPAAFIASCRRGGATATIDQLQKYATIKNMPIVSSNYWNMVHGNAPEEVLQDEEGVQTMRVLGTNMAWLLKCIEAGKANGIETPCPEPKIKTNFIR